MLTPNETAARMGVSPGRLKRMRGAGNGPAYLRLGHRVIRYLVADVNDWLDIEAKRAR